jgi:hypothetical protein
VSQRQRCPACSNAPGRSRCAACRAVVAEKERNRWRAKRSDEGKRRCSACGVLGHNSRTCDSLPASERKTRETYAAYATGELTPHKNMLHWERLAAKREAVRDRLERALAYLSTRAPAATEISRAIQLLEECR